MGDEGSRQLFSMQLHIMASSSPMSSPLPQHFHRCTCCPPAAPSHLARLPGSLVAQPLAAGHVGPRAGGSACASGPTSQATHSCQGGKRRGRVYASGMSVSGRRQPAGRWMAHPSPESYIGGLFSCCTVATMLMHRSFLNNGAAAINSAMQDLTTSRLLVLLRVLIMLAGGRHGDS